MRSALKTAGLLIVGAIVLAVLWLSLPVSSLKDDLAPPDMGARPPDMSGPEEPLVAPPDQSGGEPFIPSGDPFTDWTRVEFSVDPFTYETYLQTYPQGPFAEEALRRLILLSPTASRGDGPGALEPGAGVPDPDPAEAALRDQLREADIAFNAPDRMMFRETARIELALSPRTSGVAPETRLSEDLPGEVVSVEGVDYALRMQATLSGQDFEIEPEGPVARTVLADRPTTWDWTVKPLRHGPGKPLTLRLEAVIERGGADLPPLEIETFSASIMVEVTLWDRAVELAKEISPLHATVVAVGGTAVGAIGWLWRLRRRPKPPAPQQVEVTHRFAGGEATDDEPADRAPPERRGPVSR